MTQRTGIRGWLWRQRDSRRLAWLLQMSSRVFTSLINLFLIKLLVDALGKPLNSLYLASQYVFQFGGLGDFGMGGAVAIRTGEALGQGKHQQLKEFLAAARGLFLVLAIFCAGGFIVFSHLLARLPGFDPTANSGPIPQLFVVGGLLMATVLLYGYVGSLNYACGNITWPILPELLLLLASLFCHVALARAHQPLWIQYIPYVCAGLFKLLFCWFYVRQSHPDLAVIFPIKFDWKLSLTLFESSFWVFLCSIGSVLYKSTDGTVIKAGFQADTLTDYANNYKFCDLAVFVVLTASLVSLPKITQLMASPEAKDQERVRFEMVRLNQFQTLLGCSAALAYLWGNNLFMKVWWAHATHPVLPAAINLQLAFALNLAVTTCGDAGIQLALRSGKRGLRTIGSVVALTGLLNLGLSIIAMKNGSLWGVAMATVLAQSILSLFSSGFICRQLKLDWLSWLLKAWVVPIAGISIAGWLRTLWPPDVSIFNAIFLTISYLGMLGLAAWALGVNFAFLKDELKIIRRILPR